jgi:hypothetical protein
MPAQEHHLADEGPELGRGAVRDDEGALGVPIVDDEAGPVDAEEADEAARTVSRTIALPRYRTGALSSSRCRR